MLMTKPMKGCVVLLRDSLHSYFGGVGAFVGTLLAGSSQAINALAQPIGNIFGDAGGIEIEIPFNAPSDKPTRLWLSTLEVTKEIIFDICDQYTIQGDLFSKAILDNTEVPTPLEDALHNMLVLEAVFKSSESGQWVSL